GFLGFSWSKIRNFDVRDVVLQHLCLDRRRSNDFTVHVYDLRIRPPAANDRQRYRFPRRRCKKRIDLNKIQFTRWSALYCFENVPRVEPGLGCWTARNGSDNDWIA